MTLRKVLVFLVGAVVWLSTARAHAQVPQAVYDDVKSIIEELLTQEVAQAVVPQLVCRSGRREAATDTTNGVEVGGRRYVFEATTHYPRTLQRVFNREFGALRTTIRDESADLAAYIAYRALTKPNDAEASLRVSKLSGVSEGEAQNSPIVYDPLTDELLEECTTNVKTLFDKRTFVAEVTPLGASCKSTSDTYECNLALAFATLLKGKAALAEDYLVRAVAAVLAKVLLPDAPTAYNEVVLALRTYLQTPATGGVDITAELAKIVTKYKPGVQDAAAHVTEKLKDLNALRVQWRVSTNGGGTKLDIATFVDAIVGPTGYLGALCNNQSSPVCASVNRLYDLKTSPSKLLAFLRLASRGEHREVAHLAVQSLFATTDDRSACKDEDACDSTEIYKRFADSVVLYVLDVAEGEVARDATRQAFRKAAVDVVKELGEGGGVDRGFGKSIVLPDLALRVSWSGSYVNEADGPTRVMASANWLNFRVPFRAGEATYTALEVSLVDPLAPLSELALRRNTDVDYEGTEKLGYNLFTPRLEVLVGVPALSRHLVLSGGASFRWVAPIFDADIETPEGVRGYRYQSIFDDGDQWPRFIEFGFALKYLI